MRPGTGGPPGDGRRRRGGGRRRAGQARAGTGRLSLAAALLALALSPALVAAAGPGPTTKPPSAARDCEAGAACPVLGVNADLGRYPPGARAALLDRLAAAGLSWVRQPLSWAAMAPEPGILDWRALDAVVADAAERDLRLLVSLSEAPAWARQDPAPAPGLWLCGPEVASPEAVARRAPPTRPADLAAFAGALAGRYGSRLAAIEVWPEPNLLPGWRATGPDPEDYARLLSPVAAAVHAASPGTQVISGALAPTTDVGVCHLSDLVFLDRLARSGALAAVDGIGIQPYGLRSGPVAEGPDREQLNFRRAELHHEVLRRHGLDRPLWALAWGWNGLDARWTGRPSPWGSQAPELAARWTAEGYAYARAHWPWLGPMFLAQLQPAAAPDDPAWGFALLDAEGRPTALWALAEDLAAGRWPGPPEPPPSRPSPRTLALLAALVAAGLLLALRRWLAAPLRRVLAGRGPSTRQAALVYAGAALVDIAAPWPASLVALPLMALVATLRPAIALVAVAVALPFYYGLDLWIGPQALDGVEGLLLLALAGRLAAWYAGLAVDDPVLPAATGPDGRPWRARLAAFLRALAAADWLVLALVAWAALSLAWSEFPAPALRQWRTVVLEPALFYALLRVARDRARAATLALDGLVAGGALAAVAALAGVALLALGLGGAGVSAEGVLRATGPYASPNNLALLLGRLVPVVAAFGLWGTGRRRRLYRLAGLPILLGLLATFSRGALLVGLPATALYLGWLALRSADRRRLLALAAVGGLAALSLAPFAGTERVAGAFRLAPGGTGFLRLRLWQSALAMGRDHPWGGVGLDNFLYLYRDRYVLRDAVQERFLNHPHNWLLDWWTRLGLVGLGLFLGLVATNLQAGARGLRRAGAPRVLAAAALGAQLYALAHGLLDNSFFLVDLAMLWWIAQAALLAASEDVAAPPPGGGGAAWDDG